MADPERRETDRPEPPAGSGRRIGPYQTLREIGHGGMGSVFLAARADDEYQKHVAIKLIKGGSDNEEVVRHFRRERQILASVEHPNIARLLDGGTTDEGLPYFVMEYVEGRGLLEHCDRESLPTHDRLRLFQSVCSAVGYAHSNLVIHRDIKPSNILVSREGVPKLLDFGIAKFLSPGLQDEALSVTRMVFTPLYASPEQARGEPLATSTDVYSLGVVLYELLTGRRPYRVKGRQPLELLRAVAEEEPERPSTAVDRPEDGEETLSAESVSRTREGTPEKLRRRLQGDLDAIVLLALRKEPKRRYPSVEALSQDIDRYLQGRPVAARKGTWSYTAGKFLRRNALAAGAGAALFVLLAAFAVAMATQSARTKRALGRAEKERMKAEKVSGFLVGLFKVSDPGEARGKTITAREILDQGSAKIGSELQDQPEVRATLMDTMGTVYYRLGLYDKALPLLQEALQTRRTLPADPREVADSLYSLGDLLDERGDYGGAEAAHREALALRRKALGNEHVQIAKSLNALGNALLDKGDAASAEPLYREALALNRKLLGNDNQLVAGNLNNLAGVLRAKGDAAGAESLYREALALKRKLLGNDHPAIATTLNNLATVLVLEGDFAGAEANQREALALDRRVLGDDHPALATDLSNLAEILEIAGKYPESEALKREALGLRRRVLGDEHPDVAVSLDNLAEILGRRGNYTEAEALAVQAVALERKVLPDHPEVADALGALATILEDEGHYARAEALDRESLAIRRKLQGEEHPDVAAGITSLGNVLRDEGDAGGAEALYREALALRRKVLPPGHADTADTLMRLGDLLAETARPEEAEPLLREGLAILRHARPGPDHPETAEAESLLGGGLTRLRRFEEAEVLLLRSYPVLKATRGERSVVVRRALERLVRLYEAWHKPGPMAEYQARLTQLSGRR